MAYLSPFSLSIFSSHFDGLVLRWYLWGWHSWCRFCRFHSWWFVMCEETFWQQAAIAVGAIYLGKEAL